MHGLTRRDFLGAGAAAAAGFPALCRGAVPARTSRLALWFTVEALRPETLEAVRPWLRPGGLRRLIDEGSYFPDCRLNSSSFTSSSTATFQTGAYPAGHGILADRWYEHSIANAEAERQQASTLAEQVRLADSRNRSHTIAVNRSLALLASGAARARQADIYTANAEGVLELSSEDQRDPWWRTLPRTGVPDAGHSFDWRAMYAAQGAPALRQLIFNPAKPLESIAEWQASPVGISYQFRLLREILTRERAQRAGIDLVQVLLDGFGMLARSEGADSPLQRELLLNLDVEIEALLSSFGPGTGDVMVVLHGGHGGPDIPVDRSRAAVDGAVLAQAIENALSREFGAGATRRIETYLYPFLYLRTKADTKVRARDLRIAAGRAALETGTVQAFYTLDDDCSHTGEFAQRLRNSFHATRSGDVMFSYLPGYIEETGSKRGVTFGSLYNYDTRVPVILWGPRFRAQQFEDTIEAVDLAPTIARVLEVGMPSSCVGTVLGQVFAPVRPDKAAR